MQSLFYSVYKLLGPRLATKVAVNKITLFLADKLLPSKMTYTGKFGIKLNMSPREALVLGFPFLKVVNPYDSVVFENLMHDFNFKTFINVGAAEGWYILLAKKLNPQLEIYAFEPIKENYAKLGQNLNINDFGTDNNVTIENLAITSHGGTVDFWESGSTSSLFKKNAELFGNAIKTSVKATSLDSYFVNKKINSPYMLMIDTEGAEGLVIDGAATLFTKQPPKVIFIEILEECLKNAGDSVERVENRLMSYGYARYLIKQGKLVAQQPGEKTELANKVFILKP